MTKGFRVKQDDIPILKSKVSKYSFPIYYIRRDKENLYSSSIESHCILIFREERRESEQQLGALPLLWPQ